MSPGSIVRAAIGEGLDLIAVCDHNSAENVTAVIKAAGQSDLEVLPGMEITSKEEVHLIGLFERSQDALEVQILVYEHLDGTNDESYFGQQVVVDADGDVIGHNNRLLIGATDLSLEEIVQVIHEQNGLVVAAHIDREGFGIIGQLGIIPEELHLDALEISSRMSLKEARSTFEAYNNYPFICSSDAHSLGTIGTGRTSAAMKTASFYELKMALRGEYGRSIYANAKAN
jgi:predicted metal-dependent phosphoesterase TrpH